MDNKELELLDQLIELIEYKFVSAFKYCDIFKNYRIFIFCRINRMIVSNYLINKDKNELKIFIWK